MIEYAIIISDFLKNPELYMYSFVYGNVIFYSCPMFLENRIR